MEINEHKILQLLSTSFQLGYAQSSIDWGNGPMFLSFTQAYFTFGKANVKAWIKDGLLIPNRDLGKNSKGRLEHVRLKMLAATCNYN